MLSACSYVELVQCMSNCMTNSYKKKKVGCALWWRKRKHIKCTLGHLNLPGFETWRFRLSRESIELQASVIARHLALERHVHVFGDYRCWHPMPARGRTCHLKISRIGEIVFPPSCGACFLKRFWQQRICNVNNKTFMHGYMNGTLINSCCDLFIV